MLQTHQNGHLSFADMQTTVILCDLMERHSNKIKYLTCSDCYDCYINKEYIFYV